MRSGWLGERRHFLNHTPMERMSDCVFCKIIAKVLPSKVVFENDKAIAFLDRQPTNAGHTLLAPKVHYENMLVTPVETMAEIGRLLPKLAAAVQKGSGAEGFNITVNNGAAAGQVIPHLHFHIIPRFSSDGYKPWGHRDYKEGEAEAMFIAIRSALAS